MKAIELFAGVGGFRLGLERAGHEVVWSNEWDKYACDTYDKNFGGPINRSSITDVRAEDIPAHDLIVGGFPCQAFSIAGKRRGFEETRGTLFFEIMRIAQHHRTKYLFLENVKGLLNHDSGRTFETILEALDELGYDCQWQVLNSKNFGVPQNRERVFIIGHLRGQPRPKVFPIGTNDDNSNGSQEQDRWQGLQTQLASTLTARYAKMGQSDTYINQLNHPKHSNDRVYGTDGIAPTLNTMQGGKRQPFIQNPKMNNYKKDYNNSVAITATSYKEPPVVNGIRRLTPIECERLQGFPDNWTEGVSDTQRYKQMGNAVTVNVIEAIAKLLQDSNHIVID